MNAELIIMLRNLKPQSYIINFTAKRQKCGTGERQNFS